VICIRGSTFDPAAGPGSGISSRYVRPMYAVSRAV
jgi:hypothetical protein